MSSKLIISVTFLIIFFLTSCNHKNPESYNEYIEEFKTISVDELSDHEKLLLYIGYEDCPHCQIFVPKLYEVSREQNLDIYMIDLENNNENDYKFLEDNNILFVPDFSIVNESKVVQKLNIDSDITTVDDITNFINSYYK